MASNSNPAKTRIAVLCSGNGSNAAQIFQHFRGHPSIQVGLLLYNRKQAYAANRASEVGIPTRYVSSASFAENADEVVAILKEQSIDYLLLAGFLQLLPEAVCTAFAGKMLNIHPALLPAFGGVGMHGIHVHEAVKKSGHTQTGITIHEVNARYDEGRIIFQARCPVLPSDSVSDIATRVLALEHAHYSFVAEHFILSTRQQTTQR